jgi:hypothetical protein
VIKQNGFSGGKKKHEVFLDKTSSHKNGSIENQGHHSCRQTIDLSVTLTAHHKGNFQFKVCPIAPGQAATQACFDAHNVKFISEHFCQL